jgi:hypothetical protein
MRRQASHLEDFLKRVRGRWIVLRVCEHAAIGLLVAAAAAIVLSLLMLFQHEPAFRVAPWCLVAGAMFGAVAGLSRRPSLRASAEETDRQLKLHDLLATALAIQHEQVKCEKNWSTTLLALADARSREISPSDVILHRLNSRTWSGVVIAVVLSLTLTLISSNPLVSSAIAGTSADPKRASRQPRLTPAPSRSHSAGVGVSQAAAVTADLPNSEPASEPKTISAERGSGTSHSADGAGAGAGRTDDFHGAAPSPAAANADVSMPGGAVASGGTSASGRGTASSTSAGSTSATPTGSLTLAPWRSYTWTSDRAAAMQSLHDNRVPDRYRDLVRDYFDR